MNTIILGNGIIGLTIAFKLALRSNSSDNITIIGKSSYEGSATMAAPAMLNSFAELEKDSLKSEIDQYRFDLSVEATKQWQSFEKKIYEMADENFSTNKEFESYSKGTYVINNTAADDLDDENFDAIVKGLTIYKEPFSFVSPSDIPNYNPEQHFRATKAILIENEGWINPVRLLKKLTKALIKFPNVTFLDDDISILNHNQGSITGVVLKNEEKVISGDKYILATGATVTDLLKKSMIDIKIPSIFYGVGVSIELKSPDNPHSACIRTPNRGLACGLYTAPYIADDNYPKDHIIVGATNFISEKPYYYGRLASIEGLVKGAIEQINSNFYRADFIKTNIGWRPTSQDTYPLIGKTSINNLIIITGTKREGFHLSPVISEYIVSIIYEEPTDKKMLYFKPERSLIKSLTREEAIQKAVRHQISAAYQHEFKPSRSRMTEQLKKMYRNDIEKVHDQVGALDWGIPPEMIEMYRYGKAAV